MRVERGDPSAFAGSVSSGCTWPIGLLNFGCLQLAFDPVQARRLDLVGGLPERDNGRRGAKSEEQSSCPPMVTGPRSARCPTTRVARSHFKPFSPIMPIRAAAVLSLVMVAGTRYSLTFVLRSPLCGVNCTHSPPLNCATHHPAELCSRSCSIRDAKPFELDRVKASISSARVIATYISPRSRCSCSALSPFASGKNGIMSQRITSTARHCRPFAELIVLMQTPDGSSNLPLRSCGRYTAARWNRSDANSLTQPSG